MEDKQRSALRATVVKVRRLLEKDFQEQLEGTYNILPDGRVLESAPGDPVVRARLLDVVQHHRAGGASAAEAIDRLVREAAFTVLNRFAALQMAERRHLVRECVSQGVQSTGIRELADCAPGLRGALEDGGYRLLLEAVMDEISLDLKVLFLRRDSMAPLWPGPQALDDLLETLNDPQLADVWAEDEAIGWVYQYFNDNDVKEMRDAAKGGAPRNSRELAVRNQFFTPRYVVEFLTDNTLGRLWYEMTRGETVLRERCRYFVRRPTEIFLKPGESALVSANAGEAGGGQNLSHEELLRQPVYIPHRSLKDPRDLRLLDPACGSMHFGLYAFDLFSVIYDEAWEIAHGTDNAAKFVETFAPFVAFAASFPDKASFLVDVPRLIVEHNIHGIDIDPRAVQIAGLSLWLRAQRAWHQAAVKPADRPRITRSNVVCAEPMPGEKELLREFVEQQFPVGEQPAFSFLLEKIFDRMALAGEAGSLLRIEEEIRTTIADAQALWTHGPRHEQAPLLPEVVQTKKQGELRLDLSGITDEQFWERAEQRIYDALEKYAQQAESGGEFQRRLFADDTAQGFAFIDLCRQHYDVAVMNPPFGDASVPSKTYINETYGDTKGDVYKAFVECFYGRLVPAGYLGIISSRTGFFLGTSEDWRTRVVLQLFRPIALADLGMGVLDAMVEVAAYVLRTLSNQEVRNLTLSLVPMLEKVERDRQDRFSLPKWQAARGGLKRHQAVAELERLEADGFIQRCTGDIVRYTPLWPAVRKVTAPPVPVFPALVCLRVLANEDKGAALGDCLKAADTRRTFVSDPGTFGEIPGSPFAYWVGPTVRRLFRVLPEFETKDRIVRAGGQTSDDFRYLRAFWECRVRPLVGTWRTYVKGGAYSPFYNDLPLVAHWHDQRKTFAGFLGRPGRSSEQPSNYELYFQPGITWPLRARAFSPQVMPSDSIFTVRGYAILAPVAQLLPVLGLTSSAVFDYLFKILLGRFGFPEFVVGVLQKLPMPDLANQDGDRLGQLALQGWTVKRSVRLAEQTSHAFVVSPLLASSGATLGERASAWAARVRTTDEALTAIQTEIDDIAFRVYGLDAADRAALKSTLAIEATDDDDVGAGEEEEEEATSADASTLAADLLAYALGCAFGRWDIRYATGERPAPELPDPFAPLPVCPPGMLQGDDGLPLSPEAGRRLRAEGHYPLDVAWDGILVDDSEHPLDLERRVRAALTVLWSDRADALENEACTLLGVPTLREWFCRPAGFFADHLKRYSKSRRQAPIYWPLSTASGAYTIWAYYHRLTADTLFQLAEYVELKLGKTRQERLRASAGQPRADGRESAKLAKRAAEQVALEQELEEMKAELLRVAALPYKPDLNDGVQITAAPLWKLFRLSKWRKDLEATWKSLEQEEHEWAHLAYAIWPDRVREKCKTDRSLAIAHGLEEFCEVEVATAKKRRKKSK
jgi:hypothetical protein